MIADGVVKALMNNVFESIRGTRMNLKE